MLVVILGDPTILAKSLSLRFNAGRPYRLHDQQQGPAKARVAWGRMYVEVVPDVPVVGAAGIVVVNCHVYLALCTVICLYPLSPFHLKHRIVQTLWVLPRSAPH